LGFPPRFSDQKTEGQLLPVIRKLSESQHGTESWLGAGGALSTLPQRSPREGLSNAAEDLLHNVPALKQPQRGTRAVSECSVIVDIWGIVSKVCHERMVIL